MVVYDTTGNRKEPALLFRLITDHGNNKESKIPYYRGSDFPIDYDAMVAGRAAGLVVAFTRDSNTVHRCDSNSSENLVEVEDFEIIEGEQLSY
jgi:hypothetical protein